MRKRVITLGLLALLASLTLTATRVEATGTPSNKGTKTRKPPQDKGPGETRSEREQRLLRECRGRPNSGACEGYAS